MEGYTKGALLGEGTFGKVHQYTQNSTGEIVAIKKIHLAAAKEGVNMTALREIKLLRELSSPHFVRLLDVFHHKVNLCLVFDYCESDLEQLIKDHRTLLSAADVKAYIRMILQALEACHAAWVLHRDIKPNNFLITTSGELKLADFGLARIFGSPDRQLTNQVFALWYRAPELFFGSRCYGPNVDIWAAGCIFAELMLRRPWFQTQTAEGMRNAPTEIGTLGEMFAALGTPQEGDWPSMGALPNCMRFSECKAPPLRTLFPKAPEDAHDLLSRMMTFDPTKRITASEALQHRYFRSTPAATPAARLPRAPLRASHPLSLPPKGGSALQQAPPVAEAAMDLGPSAQSLARSPLTEANRDASGASHPAPSSLNATASPAMPAAARPLDWGTLRQDPTAPRPQVSEDDLRSLKKRKLDLT
ncbi:hypothetical protein WJX73_008230 [Symbiochloris irregularis]|uniref:[RNA-polymerase]-subunit kinase n=1 Tax=Symbiochloris irregularis TaxID=706552 RepID=A0AAW1NX24_9CHLO